MCKCANDFILFKIIESINAVTLILQSDQDSAFLYW
jgi:hypothetical protein